MILLLKIASKIKGTKILTAPGDKIPLQHSKIWQAASCSNFTDQPAKWASWSAEGSIRSSLYLTKAAGPLSNVTASQPGRNNDTSKIREIHVPSRGEKEKGTAAYRFSDPCTLEGIKAKLSLPSLKSYPVIAPWNLEQQPSSKIYKILS